MEAAYWVFLVVILMVVTLAWKNRPRTTYSQLPKKIWSYWDNPDDIPASVQLCLQSWKKHHPDHDIVLLNKKTYKGYVNIPQDLAEHPHVDLHRSRFAELVALYTLAEHGGVWMEPSFVLQAPFDEWLFPKYAEFAGYSMKAWGNLTPVNPDKPLPILTASFIACNKGSPFLQQWRDEFIKIFPFKEVPQYVESRQKMGVDLQRLPDPVNHLSSLAAQTVLQLQRYPLDTLILRSAEDGPLWYLRHNSWDVEKAWDMAHVDKIRQTPLLQFLVSGDDRAVIDKKIKEEWNEHAV
jgi:hypothetical protein